MSKVLIETSILNDIADTINEKSEQDKKYKVAEMAAEIEKISGSKPAAIKSLTVTKNGTYTPPIGIDGYKPVIVNIARNTQKIVIPENNTITIPDWAKEPYTVISMYDGGQQLAHTMTFGQTELNPTDASKALITMSWDNRNVTFVPGMVAKSLYVFCSEQ